MARERLSKPIKLQILIFLLAKNEQEMSIGEFAGIRLMF